MFNEFEKEIIRDLLTKERERIERDFKDMEAIGESFFINEGLLFENMHVRKKLESRLDAIEDILKKIKDA